MKKFIKKILSKIINKILIQILRAPSKLLFYFLKPIAFLYKKVRSNIIFVLTEKGFDAGDNAYFFYKFLKKKGYKCFFIVTKTSVDIGNIKEKIDIIFPNSIRHYFYIQTANYVLFEDILYMPKYYIDSRKISGKLIFLQHGITLDTANTYIKCNFDIFITSTILEQQYIMKMTKCGVNKIKLTGLARFDDVYNNTKDSKLILIMPTWRAYLHDTESLLNSEYLKKWNSLVKNQKLQNYCLKNNYEIIFYPHVNIRKYLGNNFYNYDKVKNKSWNVHDLLINCSLIITDYSSVAFDVAYQMKPVLYYQFDKDFYYKHHREKGYYDFKNGIGFYCEEENSLVKKIIYLTKNGLNEEMKNKIKSTFYKIDNNNCERIYNEIIKI